MKTLRWFKGEQVWFTELGVRIASNDLLNELNDALTNYMKAHKRPTMAGAVEAVHKAGGTIRFSLVPNKKRPTKKGKSK